MSRKGKVLSERDTEDNVLSYVTNFWELEAKSESHTTPDLLRLYIA
jgi:hypothetical protein